MTMRKVTLDQIKSLKGQTKKSDVDALTDKEINEAALSDPDSVVPTEEDLKKFTTPKEREHD